MKKLLIVSAILIVSSASYGQIDKEHQLHFAAGAVTSSATYLYVYHKTKDRKKAKIYGLASAFVVGLGKELYDEYKYKGYDNKDLIATVLGGVTLTFTIDIFNR
jgi:uncharacterized protein YfiM (DUF2279 family)